MKWGCMNETNNDSDIELEEFNPQKLFISGFNLGSMDIIQGGYFGVV